MTSFNFCEKRFENKKINPLTILKIVLRKTDWNLIKFKLAFIFTEIMGGHHCGGETF